MGIKDGIIAPLCESAESCFCGATDNVEILTNHVGEMVETAGLYHECKCDFWSRLCEDTQVGEACDNAAAYCCGDYAFKFKHDSPIAVAYLHLTIRSVTATSINMLKMNPDTSCNQGRSIPANYFGILVVKATGEVPSPKKKRVSKRYIMQQMVRIGEAMMDGGTRQ